MEYFYKYKTFFNVNPYKVEEFLLITNLFSHYFFNKRNIFLCILITFLISCAAEQDQPNYNLNTNSNPGPTKSSQIKITSMSWNDCSQLETKDVVFREKEAFCQKYFS